MKSVPRFLLALFAATLFFIGGLQSDVAQANQFEAATPTSDFTDNNDGTVTHKTTGLTWKRCSEGQTWTGSACSGSAKTYTWAQANALSTNSWQLPTIEQLRTIVDSSRSNPAINTTIFRV